MSASLWTRWRDELARIRYRLLLINVFIVSVPLLGIGFARFYEREMLRALEDDMIHQAELLRAMLLVDAAGLQLEARGPALATAARDTRTRIRLLDSTGTVRADSHAEGPPEGDAEGRAMAAAGIAPMPREWTLEPMANVSTRPEVRRALAGGYGAATRVWSFDGGERVYLFSALPIVSATADIVGVVYVTRSTLPVLAAMHRLRGTLWRVLFAALAATAVMTLFLAATISRPLSRLTEIANRIAAGDRRGRLALDRRDEIGQLARAFDTMARRLDARAADVADLAANLSHEFKSPLTSIRGGAELLLEGAADDPHARALFLANIREDAHRLDRLVTRLLELSRAEADTTPIETLDFRDVVQDAVAANRGPLPIDLEYRSARRRVTGRRPLLLAAVENLLDNAQQHGRADSRITVRVDDAGDGRIRIGVRNAGPPISPANLPRIWERFFTTRAEAGGTGLGLPIVASIVRSHGGSVAVDSTGDATTFAFELPAA
jgi:two-component system, OmpR family, sensor histidine kinase ChvG